MNVAGLGIADEIEQKEKTAGQKLIALILSIMPWAIVGALLYAGLFIKQEPVIEQVTPHAIDRRDIILGVSHVEGDTFLAAGNYGKILISKDKGLNWELQNSTIDTHFQDVTTWDANHAVAVGNLGRVVVTDDGGNTWKEVDAPKSDVSNKLIRVHAYPNGEALAVGEMGTVIQSTDYGNTWSRLREEEDVFFNDIARVDENTIVIAAEFGNIYRSTDNGETWETITTDSPNSFMAIDFRDALNGVAVGLAGAIVVTEDGGATWVYHDTSQPKPLKESVAGLAVGASESNTEHLMDVAWSATQNEWVVVGNKGRWMTFSAAIDAFDIRTLSDTDFTSHSELALTDDGFLAVGETEGYMDLKTRTWNLLHN